MAKKSGNTTESLPETLEVWKRRGIVCAATGCYVGYVPVAPGTVGSILGAGLVWLLWDAGLTIQILLCLFLAGVGVWVSDRATPFLKRPDSPRIVIDEIVGMMVTMIGVPNRGMWLFGGFLLFRVLDIVKFPPANILDSRYKNGWGVVGDDIVSGIYGCLFLHMVLRASF